MENQVTIDSIFQRMLGMSPADFSVLEASSKTPDSAMTTMPGSPNDLLWSEMEKQGWLIGHSDTISLPEGKDITLRVFKYTLDGYATISTLVNTTIKIRHANHLKQQSIDSKMAEIYNTFCVKFSNDLIQQAREQGGKSVDVLSLWMHTSAHIIKASIRPEDYEKALDLLYTQIKQKLALPTEKGN